MRTNLTCMNRTKSGAKRPMDTASALINVHIFNTSNTTTSTNSHIRFVLAYLLIFSWCTLLVVVAPQSLICKRIPRLTPQQLRICQRSPEILSVIRAGVQLALAECQQLFHNQEKLHSAWNCSAWIQNSLNRLYVDITDQDIQGTKEASFAHALFSAGVTHALSEACTRSNFPHCSCGSTGSSESIHTDDHYDDQPSQLNRRRDASNKEWKWQGCGQNVKFGVEIARLFLDSYEHGKMSPYALVNLHNNNVGRRIIKDGVVARCQCHGFSGTCTFKTCWNTLNVFRQATQSLYSRYSTAKMVSYSWLLQSYRAKYESQRAKGRGRMNTERKAAQLKLLQQWIMNSTNMEHNQPNVARRLESTSTPTPPSPRKRDLIYLKPSVNLCQNVRHRVSNQTLSCHSSVSNHGNSSIISSSDLHFRYDVDNRWPPAEPCDSLCCGRGYRSKVSIRTEKCDCEFKFCCSVSCKQCTITTTEYECI